MVKIVVDSGCDMSDEVRKRCGVDIDVVPLNMQVGDKHFTDDSNFDLENYLKEMEACKTAAKSAAPAPELFVDKFKGDESVFVVTLSSHLSASYANANVAMHTYLDEIGKKFIHVFDSLSASVGESLIAMKIAELSKNNFSESEIIERVNNFISDMKTYFVLERFENIVKNGRMNAYVAKLASVLNIKPICAGINGKMTILDKARGYNKAVTKLIDIMKNEKADFENRILGITHVKCLEKAQSLRDEIMKSIKFKDAIIMEASGLCATYADRNGLVIAF